MAGIYHHRDRVQAGLPVSATHLGDEPETTRLTFDLPLRCLWTACFTLCLATFCLGILSQFSYNSLLDDSFMFYRYAYRLGAEHRLSWNPHGPPTYGLTALGYLAPVFVISNLLSSQPLFALWMTSLLSGVLFLALMGTTVLRHCALEPGHRRWLLLLLAYTVTASTPSLKFHFTSGMDTAFAMAYLASYILLAAELERKISSLRAIGLGLWGGLAFIIRPDLLILTLIVPVFLFFFSVEAGPRRSFLLALGATIIAVAVQIALCSAFLESPLPLPFYAKSTRLYGDYIYTIYATMPRVQLFEFCLLHIHLIALIGFSLVFDFRSWWRKSGALDKGLLAGSTVFVAYYYFFVLQILGRPQRFYYPILPALIFVACRCAALTIPAVLPALPTPWPWRRVFALGLFVGIFGLLPGLQDAMRSCRKAENTEGFSHFDLLRIARGRERNTWAGLDRFSTLPDKLVIATTDIGLPGALNLDKTVVDLAGIQETAFARKPFSADWLLTHYHPDLIYMPHPHLREMIQDIEQQPIFGREYDYFPAETLHAKFGVAVWRDSPYYPQMRDILATISSLPDDGTGPAKVR